MSPNFISSFKVVPSGIVNLTFEAPSGTTMLLGFIVFRALDILKPMGIERLERMPGGFGIMMDDFAAGVLGNVIVRVALELPALLGTAAPA